MNSRNYTPKSKWKLRHSGQTIHKINKFSTLPTLDCQLLRSVDATVMFCYKQNIFDGTKEHTYGWMDGLMVYAVVLLIYITIHDEATRLRTHCHVCAFFVVFV